MTIIGFTATRFSAGRTELLGKSPSSAPLPRR